MRIYFPIGIFYPSRIGGPARTIYWHTTALVTKNVDVKIVTTNFGIDKGRVAVNKELQLECGNIYYGKGNSKNIKTLVHSIMEIKNCDIIHLNSLFNAMSISVFLASILFYRHRPIVWSPRGELSNGALKFSNRKKKPILILYKLLTSKIIFHSTSDKETLEIKSMFGNSKIIQIPNLIKPSFRLLVTKVKEQILFMGRIHPIKAIHKLIEGLSTSRAFLNSNFKLIIAGSVENRQQEYLKQLKGLIKNLDLKNKIEFIGHIDGEAKERLYAESYVLILPSESENFGNVVIESLNQGTPVIASYGTPWSILVEYCAGHHISNSPLEISKKIDEIISLEKSNYLLMRENAAKLFDEKYNIDNQIHWWIKKYNEILCSKTKLS